MDSMWAEIYGKARASAANENNKIERLNKKYIIIKKNIWKIKTTKTAKAAGKFDRVKNRDCLILVLARKKYAKRRHSQWPQKNYI